MGLGGKTAVSDERRRKTNDAHLLLPLCLLRSLLALLAVGRGLLHLVSSLVHIRLPLADFLLQATIPLVHALASCCNRLQWRRRPDSLIGLSCTMLRPLLTVDHSALILVRLVGAANASKMSKRAKHREG